MRVDDLHRTELLGGIQRALLGVDGDHLTAQRHRDFHGRAPDAPNARDDNSLSAVKVRAGADCTVGRHVAAAQRGGVLVRYFVRQRDAVELCVGHPDKLCKAA